MVNCKDCKFAGTENTNGQTWCEKKSIYVNTQSQETCSDYEKK